VLCAAGISGLIPLALKSPLFQVNKKGHRRLFLDKPHGILTGGGGWGVSYLLTRVGL